MNLQEQILIQQSIQGDRKSQKTLYELYASKMFSVCLRYAKNQMDAEDILQDGFVKLFNNLSKYRGEGSFEGWVRRIFMNTAIEYLRKQRVTTVDSETIEDVIKDKRENPIEKMYQKDLMSITNALSEGYKTVFNLYAIQGFTHKEIAAHLGITESTSKSQFSRAKSLLRGALAAL